MVFLTFCLLCLSFAAALPSAAQTQAVLTLDDVTLAPGESRIVAGRLSCEVPCGVIALTLLFDGAVISVDDVVPGNYLGSVRYGRVAVVEVGMDNALGVVGLAMVALGDPPQPPSDILFEIQVTGINPGVTQFRGQRLLAGDLEANPLTLSLAGGTVTVSSSDGSAPQPVLTETAPLTVETSLPVGTITPTPADSVCYVSTTRNDVGIHVGPDRGRTIRGNLGANVLVLVTGQTTDDRGNVWYNILPQGVTTELDRYWVAADDVDEQGNCANVPQVAGSEVITTGSGGGGTFTHRFVAGERQFAHRVSLPGTGTYAMTCLGTPFNPFFVFNNVPSNGQTTVTITAGGTVNLVVSQTLTNQGRTVGVDNYTCTLTRQ